MAVPEKSTGSSRRLSFFELLRAQRNPLRFLTELSAAPDDVIRVTFRRLSIAIVKHPDFVQQLLVAEHARTEKGRTLERALFFVFLGDGLLNSKGEAHRRQRRLMLPAFHRGRLAGYGQTMVDAALAMAARWRDGEDRDLGAEMMNLTLAVVGQTLFSSDIEGTAQIITDSFHQLSIDINRLAFPGARWLLRSPLPFARRIRRAQQTLDDVVYGLIKARRARGEDTGDLLSMILLAEDAEHPGEHLSDVEVRDQVMTLLFAGHETAANALTWTLWLLAQHPEIEAALQAELARVLGDRTPGFADAPNLILTEQIIREALRLYPPVWALGRRSLTDLEFGGHPVPQGSLVLASPWIVHRDARWYPEPEVFRPTRWTPEFRAALPRFAYFPFGGGARSCVGENFAWLEFTLIIATLAQRWSFTLPPETRAVKPEARITLHPDGPVHVRLHQRQAS